MAVYHPSSLRGRSAPPQPLLRNRYLRVVAAIVIIVIASSFYVYQRVLVRRLIAENELIDKQTVQARLSLAGLERAWSHASSLASVETALDSLDINLRPTAPAQNLALPADLQPLDTIRLEEETGRYAGLVKALDKLKSHVPVVTPAEAEAKGFLDQK
jgi:hypothetical protein